jgi:hypothetical protein
VGNCGRDFLHLFIACLLSPGKIDFIDEVL